MESYKGFLVKLSDIIYGESLKIKEIIDLYGTDAKSYPDNVLRKLVDTYKVMDIAIKTAKIPPLNNDGSVRGEFVEAINSYSMKLSALT